MSHAKRTLLALGLLVAAGCSNAGGTSSSGGTPTETTSMSREDYAMALANWLCADLATCCGAKQQSFDRDQCVAVKQKAELHRLASEEAHGVRLFDGRSAATCVATLKETPADCGPERRVLQCFQTYDGVREVGEPCGGKIECRGSVSGDVACVAGRCTERLAAGDVCQDLPDDVGRCDVCRPDARCRAATDGNHYCYGYEHRRGVAGDRCQRDPTTQPVDPTKVLVMADCLEQDGLYCSGDGVCTPFVPLGGACSSSLCEPGARCADGVCAAGLQAGASCGGDPAHQCGAGLYCSTARQCTAYAAEGAPCDAPTLCAGDLLCVSEPDGGRRCAAEDFCSEGLEHLARQAGKLS
jgi:hypothetical protein